MTSAEILALRNISVHYGGVHALTGVDFSLRSGEIVALMGPNGAGKSTLLKSMFGLAPILDGSVSWRGKSIKPIPHEVVGLGISFVPQGRQIFKSLSVKENLEMGAFAVKSSHETKRRIEEVLNLFPILRTKLHASAKSLSGGQQQMVAIARGLMTEPELLLLDEPTLGLSPKVVKEVIEKIKEINKIKKTTIVIVEHNIRSVLSIVDRVYILDKGKVILENKPEDISSETLEKIFTGAYTNLK